MPSSLFQIVDMTQPEVDGIGPHVKLDSGGRHVLELVEAEGDCDVCDREPELVETEDGITVRETTVYKIAGAGQSGLLCQEHVAQQPYHAGFIAAGGEA